MSEPIGILLLSAVLKENGFETKLCSLKKHNLSIFLNDFSPDIVAYGAMTPDIRLMKIADKIVLEWAEKSSKSKLLRIMGGAHPTFFPEILDEMKLDAICVGEGENAILELVKRFEAGQPLNGISNIIPAGGNIEGMKKELIKDLDSLPFADRNIFYDATPLLKDFGLRGILTSRGCPYNCTYCFNHAYVKMFSECGKIFRRRSVENVFKEIKMVIKNYPEVRMIRFADDTFIHKMGKWEEEFFARYKKEINLPFYCLMRSNTLTDETAKHLKAAGCISIGMSLESGSEEVRNKILRRGLTDKVVTESFKMAQKYNIYTYGNGILGIPGTTLKDDIETIKFMKKIKMTDPTFTIFTPFPKTELTEYGIKNGYFHNDLSFSEGINYFTPVKMKNMTEKERMRQLNYVYLGPLFCCLPWFIFPLINVLSYLPLKNIYYLIMMTVIVVKHGLYIFPGIYPLNPIKIIKVFTEALFHFTAKKELK